MRYRYWLWTTTILILAFVVSDLFSESRTSLALSVFCSLNISPVICFPRSAFFYIYLDFFVAAVSTSSIQSRGKIFLFSNGHYYSLELAHVISFELPLWQATWHPGDFFSDNFATWIFFISRERRVQDASKLLPRWTRFAHVNVFYRSLFISPTFSLPSPSLSFLPSLLSFFSPTTRRFLIEIIIYRGYFLFRHPASRRETLARSILLAHFLSYPPFLGKRNMRAYDNHLRDGVRTMTILSFISFGNFLSRNANSASFEWTISS